MDYIKILRNTGYGLGILVILIIITILFSPVLRMYLLYVVSPKAYRYKYFCKLGKANEEIYILGTPHEYLFKNNESYSLLHIDAVIKNLNPDLILLESRETELMLDNKADGPLPEMLYANLTASSLNIPVGGVDYWSPDDGKPSSTYPKRDDKITENIINQAKGHKKVLVLLGSDHVIKDIPRLKRQGYKVKDFSRKEKDKLFELNMSKLTYPREYEHYLDKRIQREKTLIGNFYKDMLWMDNAHKMIKGLEAIKRIVERTR